jgi:uncharacterized protein
MRVKRIKFKSQGFRLKGLFHLPGPKNRPENQPENPPLVVGSHGLEGSKESPKQEVLAKILPENGIAFFRFDHRGCGESEGEFIKETSLEKRTIDYIAAVKHILSLSKTSNKLALYGSSMGGATCINAWESLSKMDIHLCGAVLCAAPIKSRTITDIPTAANDKRPALPLNFFKENLLFDLRDKAHFLHHLLIFHGDKDQVVPVSNAHELYSAAKEPKRLIIHKNGDHQMSAERDQTEFEKEMLDWFEYCFSLLSET